MKRGVIVILLSLILLSYLAYSVTADDNLDKAYTCLKAKLGTNCASTNAPVDQVAFSLLAMAYDSTVQEQCKSALLAKSSNNECWPSSSCTLKDTALAVLALNSIGEDASKPEAWLLRQNKTADDLSWYLEIDANSVNTTRCTIKYDNSSTIQNSVVMNNNKKLSLSGSGSCLTLANSNYWLQISPSCINRAFKVSCTTDSQGVFQTAILYKKTNSDIWYVSSITQSASSGGETSNSINSLCFKQNNACNYEGSLWAAYALQKNNNVAAFLPYLIALSPDNPSLNPSAFLSLLVGSDEYPNNVRNAQKDSNGLWTLSSNGKYYDTSVSFLALQKLSDDTMETAKTYLLEHEDTSGCWNNDNKRDTAFLLYAGWPKEAVISQGAITYCEDGGYNCSGRQECTDANGEILSNFACRNSLVCCSKQIAQKTCAQKSGEICSSGQDCLDGDFETSSDSPNAKCCIDGTCGFQETPSCETNGFICSSSCSDDTEQDITSSTNDCPNGKSCCSPKSSSGKSYWWIWLLIILIILIVLGILFRNRLRLLFFQFKNKFRKGPVTGTRPGFPPAGSSQMRPMMRPMPRMAMPQPMQRIARPIARVASKTDKELEDTLKKLRDMSK